MRAVRRTRGIPNRRFSFAQANNAHVSAQETLIARVGAAGKLGPSRSVARSYLVLQVVKQWDPTGLDPRARRIVAALSGPTSFASLNAEAAREAYRRSRAPYLWPLDEVAEARDLDAGASAPPMRLFRSLARAPRFLPQSYVFLHGGGWTLGDLTTYEPLCRRLARVLRADVVWVDYRVAPEHPFPAALDDALGACRWLFANGARFGLDPGNIGVIGDSAGANLAAVAATLNANGELGAKFAAQILIYPCLDLTRRHRSHSDLAEGFLLTKAVYDWYVGNYLAGHDAEDPRVSPLLKPDLSGVAPTVVLHAGFDPLRDEAIAYVARLRRAGVPVKEIAFADMIHGFVNMGAALPQAGDALNCIDAALQALLAARSRARDASQTVGASTGPDASR
jgi:acetyl esterase